MSRGTSRRLLFSFFIFIIPFTGCDETLPPRDDPQNFLEVSFDAIDGTVVLDHGVTLLSSDPGGFFVSVKNLHDEVLQAEEEISIDIDFWIVENPGTGGTTHGDRARLQDQTMIQYGNLLTIEPESSATFFMQWDHAGLKLWEYSTLTLKIQPGNPLDFYWFESGPLTLSAEGTARLFKNIASLELQQDLFVIDYTIFVDTPADPVVDSLMATFDPAISAVVLEWQTPYEVNNHGFKIEKKFTLAGEFTPAYPFLIPGQGTTYDTTEHAFTDSVGIESGVWYYRLEKWYDWGFIQWPVGYSNQVPVLIP